MSWRADEGCTVNSYLALNIQLKVLIGLAAVLIMAQPMSDFIEKLMGIMWQNLYGLLGMMGSSGG